MNDRDRQLLEHMFEDANDIRDIVLLLGSYESFERNSILRKAAVMSLLNIGECANRLSEDYRTSVEELEVPWQSMIGLRNIAAHGYRVLRPETLWDIVTKSVPDLVRFIEGQLDL